MDFDYDLFVIGAGSGGVRAARTAANLGARVAVAEERYFGGTCVNVGCVPKKLYSYAAHFKEDFEDSAGFGWNISGREFDWHILKINKDKEINRLNGIYRNLLEENGVTMYCQRARLSGPQCIAIEEKRLSARYILLAVGGWPWIPDYPGSEFVVTSNEIFAMDKLPESLTVVGGGYIAVEFASIFGSLGRETTLIYRGNKLLRGFDEDVRDMITAQIGERVRLILEDDIREIAKQDTGLVVTLNSGTEFKTGLVLSATGRKPLTADLGLETVDVELDKKGAIIVNDRYESGENGLFAVGDVINRVALTPVALAEGELVARHLFGTQTGSTLSYENIPTAVFCHPNISSCGLTETQARAKYPEIDVYLSSFRPLKQTLSGREQHSLIKLVVDRVSDRVIGAHIVAEEAGELMQGIAVAMNAGATKEQFDNTIGIHPTLAEEFVTLRTPVSH
ncbi:MAG: glutathione-disulfide reductase [Gammaproteobacteria bacterium]|nr:glutathione-disulfide reductase [Gammaproteobacteria bacterium]